MNAALKRPYVHQAGDSTAGEDNERAARFCSCLEDESSEQAEVTYGEFEAPGISGCALLDVER